MSYADGLLSTGERILYRSKQHPFVFIWGARYTILALVIAFLLFWLGGGLGADGFSGTLRQLSSAGSPPSCSSVASPSRSGRSCATSTRSTS